MKRDKRAMQTSDMTARLPMLAVSLLWGLNWVASKWALTGFSVWSFRTLSFGLGAGTLILAARWSGADLRIESGRPRVHLAVAGVLNVGGYGVLSAFALLETSTARTTICAYTMPIWTTLLAWLLLGERLTPARILALLIGAGGLSVLLWPLFGAGLPVGALYAIGAAMSWSAGTVYLRWAAVRGHPLAIAFWQLLAGTAAVAFGFVAQGAEIGSPASAASLAGLAYGIFLGTALAYLLWFNLVGRLSASSAAIGTLLVPVVGVAASILMGERPSPTDMAGFALILLAAVLALLFPERPAAAQPCAQEAAHP